MNASAVCLVARIAELGVVAVPKTWITGTSESRNRARRRHLVDRVRADVERSWRERPEAALALCADLVGLDDQRERVGRPGVDRDIRRRSLSHGVEVAGAGPRPGGHGVTTHIARDARPEVRGVGAGHQHARGGGEEGLVAQFERRQFVDRAGACKGREKDADGATSHQKRRRAGRYVLTSLP